MKCISDIEDMALRNEDKEWVADRIAEAIANAIDSFKPHGWRKLTYWLREWGLAGANVTVIVALLGMMIGALYQAFGHIGVETEFRTRTDDRLKGIENNSLPQIQKDLDQIKVSLEEFRLSQASRNPQDPKDAKLARSVLGKAREGQVFLPSESVRDAGLRFLSFYHSSPDAWRTTLDFLSYKSFLNSITLKVLPSPHTVVTKYEDVIPPGETGPTFGVAGTAPADQAAKFIMNGKDLNHGQPEGNQYIFVTNGGIVLDHATLKNVVFMNAHVVYGGGPISMQGVYFVNCTFSLQPQKNQVNFASAILKGSPTANFTVS